MTRSEAIEHLKNIAIYSFQDGYTDEARQALDMAIKALEERKKGKWIDKNNEGGWNYCSVCGERAIDLYDFCPNCGADMRGKTDG